MTPIRASKGQSQTSNNLDDRQITHLIRVGVSSSNIFYMTFLGGVLGLLYKENNRKEAQNPP